jgi:hypothetical protein
MNTEGFAHDVFLSHSAKDKTVVRPLAERLRKDGLKVWFDEWVLKLGDSIPAKIEEGLEHFKSALQPLALSLTPFPAAPIKGSLTQFLYINWLPANRQLVRVAQVQGCGHD